MLLELLISGLLVTAVIAMTLPMLKLVHSQNRAADQHQEAIAAVQNVMDELIMRDWRELDPSVAEGVVLPATLQRQLREPVLDVSIEVVNHDDLPEAKRIRVALTWRDWAGQHLPPVELVAWRYQRESDS